MASAKYGVVGPQEKPGPRKKRILGTPSPAANGNKLKMISMMD